MFLKKPASEDFTLRYSGIKEGGDVVVKHIQVINRY